MRNPIIFISHFKVKPGQLDAYREHYQQAMTIAETTKPASAATLAYANTEGTQVSIVQVFADAQTMEAHLQGVEERAKKVSEYMEVASFEIYGQASDPVRAFVMKVLGAGVPLTTKPNPLGGYIRLEPG
jgi:quinol monooxygenase YgiN